MAAVCNGMACVPCADTADRADAHCGVPFQEADLQRVPAHLPPAATRIPINWD